MEMVIEIRAQDERADDMASKLGALASPHRLAVFRSLVRAGDKGLAAGSIAEKLEMPASSLSFHLSHLRQAGLIKDQRMGRSIIYTADFGEMAGLVRYLFEECCADEETLDGCGMVRELRK